MSTIEIQAVGVAGICCAALSGTALWLWMRRRPTPEERERRRRVAVNAAGRMVDAVLTDVHDDFLEYTYSTHGITFTASQDIAGVRSYLPENLPGVVGPVTVKYLMQNPANSIVVCEEWSGLRLTKEGVLR
jgi:hypothetical protein